MTSMSSEMSRGFGDAPRDPIVRLECRAFSLTFSSKGMIPMRNCLNCEYACHGEDYREAFCMAHNVYVYIPLDDTECTAYIPRNEEES